MRTCEAVLSVNPSPFVPKCLILDLSFPRYSSPIMNTSQGVTFTSFLSLILFFNNFSGCLSYLTVITLFQLMSGALLSFIYTATPSFSAITCLSGATGSAVAVGAPGNYSHSHQQGSSLPSILFLSSSQVYCLSQLHLTKCHLFHTTIY